MIGILKIRALETKLWEDKVCIRTAWKEGVHCWCVPESVHVPRVSFWFKPRMLSKVKTPKLIYCKKH